MALLEREITIISPESGNPFSPYPQRWPVQYDGYESDPLERVERAGQERRDYYNRVEATSKNLGVFDRWVERPSSPGGQTLLDLAADGDSASSRQRGISDGGLSADSVPRVPQPHTSWRFYTSYDNGEWRRHAAPVYHPEEEVLSLSPGRTRTESSSGDIGSFVSGALSPTFGLETSIRRMRLNRPSVYEALQSRRRRTFDTSRRMATGPRSPEMILNTSDYLPREEFRRRYEVKDYVPKRRTEYGERVIYPRVKSGSISGLESESESRNFSVFHRPRDSNFEEVTRTVHQSDLSRSALAPQRDTVEVLRANVKPSDDFGFKEKVIIPTKYKTGTDKEQAQGRSDFPTGGQQQHQQQQQQQQLQQQQTIRKSRSQYDYPMDRPVPEERRREAVVEQSLYGRERPRGGEFGRGRDHLSRSLDDYEYEESRVGRRDGRRHEGDVPVVLLPDPGPRERSRSGEREVKVVVVKKQEQRGRAEPPPVSDEGTSHRGYRGDQWGVVEEEREARHRDRDRDMGRERSPKKSLRADDLAARVRSGTLDTMRQMESQMADHMKRQCPEAADIMDSLTSGGVEGKEVTVERKEAFAEQVGLWKGGVPVEEKVTRETRYRTNDPTAGPQEFVERSSVVREGRDMEVPRSFADPRVASRMFAEAPYGRPSQADARGSADRTRGYFADERPVRRAVEVERVSNSREDRFQVKERTPTETQEKIIIPTKYRQRKEEDFSGEGSRASRERASPERGRGQTTRYPEERRGDNDEDGGGGGGGGLSRYAAFVSSQLDSTGPDRFEVSTRSALPRREVVEATRMKPAERERPREVQRLGSLHGESADGWEFDMAVREIPRN